MGSTKCNFFCFCFFKVLTNSTQMSHSQWQVDIINCIEQKQTKNIWSQHEIRNYLILKHISKSYSEIHHCLLLKRIYYQNMKIYWFAPLICCYESLIPVQLLPSNHVPPFWFAPPTFRHQISSRRIKTKYRQIHQFTK